MKMDENRSPLSDVTNILKVKKGTCRKRLADGSEKMYSYDRKSRKTMEFVFCSDSKKFEFENKLETVKQMLKTKTNSDLFNQLMDLVVFNTQEKQQFPSTTVDKPETSTSSEKFSNINMKPKFVSPSSNQETNFNMNDMFVCTLSQIKELLDLQRTHGYLSIMNMEKVGHVCQLTLIPYTEFPSCIFWNSSPNMLGDYFVNYKMFHAYSCSGMLQVQFERFCDFAGIGIVNKYSRSKMASTYATAVKVLCENSINDSIKVENEKLNNTGDTTLNGQGNQIDIMTDARHAGRKNSYHSDVTALGQLTHKVVSYQHVTKELERSSQKHELFGTKKIYDDLQSKNVSVRIHSHDRNSSVSSFLDSNHPEVLDSYDTWHASKEVRKSIAKVAKGTKKAMGTTWHPELADKVSGVKTHTYWAMRNCEGSVARFRGYLDNIVQHYSDNHQSCHPTSRCKTTLNYTCSRTLVRDPVASALLSKAIRGLYMYKHPEKYIYCRNTHYIESYHNTLLLYVDKRIHYGTPTYELRVRLGILDWNEHVDRPASSERTFRRVRSVNNRTPERVLKPKSYLFVSILWDLFCEYLTQGVRGGIDLDVDNEVIASDDSDQDDNSDDDDN